MTCTRCGARLEAERTTCGLCGNEQRAVTEIGVPPYVDRSFGSFEVGAPEIAQPSITVEAPPAPPMHGPDGPANESGSRRRAWRIVIAAVLSVALVASGVAIVSLSGSLRSTKADLDAATDRSAQTAAQLDDAQERVVTLERDLESAQGEVRNAEADLTDSEDSLEACQDLFRLAATFGTGMPSAGDQAKAAALLISCFQGELPPQLFP